MSEILSRNHLPILGLDKRADQLVSWSMRQPTQKRWAKDFNFGLRLAFVSEGNCPRMYIYWNQKKFTDFAGKLKTEKIILNSFGICVFHGNGKTLVRLPGKGKTSKTLWDSSRLFCKQQEKEDINWLVGMVKFSELGIMFHTNAECQQHLEEASAAAVIHKGPQKPNHPVEPGHTLPKRTPQPPVSAKAQQYLLRDIVYTLALRAQSSSR